MGFRYEVAERLDGTFAALAGSRWRRWLDVEGVDVLDVLRSQIHVACLRACEPFAAATPSRVRRALYRLKLGALERTSPSVPMAVEPCIAVFPRMDTDVRQIAPVVAELRRLGVPCDVVTTDVLAHTTTRRAGLPATFALRAFERAMEDATASGRQMAAALMGLPLPSVPDIGSIEGSTVASVVREVLVEHAVEVHRAVRAAREVVARGARVIVVGNDLTLHGRAIALAARARGVPSAVVLHGVTSANPMLHHFVADRVLAWGTGQADELRAHGVPDDRIVVTGSPFFDAVAQNARLPSWARLVWRVRSPLVLIALSGPGNRVPVEHHREMLDIVYRASAALPGLDFVAKLHPKDNKSFHRGASRRIRGANVRVVSARGMGAASALEPWLAEASVVVTAGSAAALEAMMRDVPVVHVDPREALLSVDYVRDGAAGVARSPEELTARIHDAITRTHAWRAAAREHVEHKLGILDGSAARRVAGALRSLALPDSSRARIASHPG